MTIPNEKTREVYIGPYAVRDVAPIPFSYGEVTEVCASRGTDPLELNVEYSVQGQNVVLLVPISSGEKLVVYRNTSLDNDAEFPQEAEFDSAKINDALDKLTRQNQDQNEALGRALRLPLDAPVDLKDLRVDIPIGGRGVKWNADGTVLVNTQYDADQLLEQAQDSVEEASRAAEIATQKAEEAEEYAASAREDAEAVEALSTEAITNIRDTLGEALISIDTAEEEAVEAIGVAKTQAVDDINTAATGLIEDAVAEITEAQEIAVAEVEASGAESVALAESWAIGDISARPEGSAKWWAEQVRQEVTGDVYTKIETDALLTQKEDVFTVDSTLNITEARVLGVNTAEVLADVPSTTDMSAAIAAASALKQDVLIAGNGIIIGSDGKTISADISTVDAYTKAQTNALLLGKQDVLTPGNNVTIQGGVISVDVSGSVYNKSEVNSLLGTKQNTLQPGAGVNIIGDTISVAVDAYTKSETQALLGVKQNILTAGEYINITNNIISATPEDMIETYTQEEWAELSSAEKEAIKVAFIYE